MSKGAHRKDPALRDQRREPIGRRPARAGRDMFVALAATAGMLAVAGVTHTWTRVAVLERKYQLARARADNERLASELEKLTLEAATWDSAARVDQAARSALAMSKAPPTSVVVVEADLPTPRARSTMAANER
jgi:cell division protein FtsL